jgi:hypothetical protein
MQSKFSDHHAASFSTFSKIPNQTEYKQLVTLLTGSFTLPSLSCMFVELIPGLPSIVS